MKHLSEPNTIKDEDLMKLTKFFGINYCKDFLNL